MKNKPFAKLLKIVGSKTDEQIMNEVESYPSDPGSISISKMRKSQ